MTYTLTNLGDYTAYSEDPRIVDGVVLAARDRPSGTKFHTHAALWDGGWTLLPDPISGSDWSVALGGTADQVVGYITPDAGDSLSRAVLWDRQLGRWQITALPLPCNAISSLARAISPDGALIVGELQDIMGIQHAAVWRRGGSGQALDWQVECLPQPDIRGYAVGISSDTGGDTGSGGGSPWIIGTILDQQTWHAVRWQHSGSGWTRQRLGLPGVPPPPPQQAMSVAEAVQDGVILGSAGRLGAASQAGYWSADGSFTELGTGPDTSANGHANRAIVGVDNADPDMPTAFVWTAATGREDLHPAGWDWSLATAIDQHSGAITGIMGMGAHSDYGGRRAIFLQQPCQP